VTSLFSLKTNPNPQKSVSGRLMLCVLPEIHARVAHLAESNKKSLNQFVVDTL
jgi:predicted HicB family RNase H-like nuclease